MNDVTNVPITKGGENRIFMTLQRSKNGLYVSVRARTEVEDFFRGLADGAETIDVRGAGRFWAPKDEATALRAYSIGPKPLPTLPINQKGDHLVFDPLCRLLLEPSSSVPGRFTLNMSFLRLVGISEGAGVDFHVKGVFTEDEVRRIKEFLTEGGRLFYASYLKPIHMSVIVSTQEISGGVIRESVR